MSSFSSSHQKKFFHPAEEDAWLYLQEKQHILLAFNYRTHRCELDIITLFNKIIHVVEVKAWKTSSSERKKSYKSSLYERGEDMILHPLEVFSPHRRLKIKKAAKEFLYDWEEGYKGLNIAKTKYNIPSLLDCSLSFDLIWVKKTQQEILYFENIF